MVDCLLGLGSNVGNRAAQLDAAVHLICGHPQIQRVSISSYHATQPVGGPTGQESFLNAALRVRTSLSASDLFAVLQDVELRLGRRRLERWGPRSIDIDILLYGADVVTMRELLIPHPRMAVRRFVLEPAREVAEDMTHSGTGMTIAELLDRLARPPHFVSITGFWPEQAANLAITAATIADLHVLLDPAATLIQQMRANRGSEVPPEAVHRILAERGDQLSALRAEAEVAPDAWHVCSYWLPELGAEVADWPAVEARRQLAQVRQRVAAQSPPPHCVIFLDPRSAEHLPAADCQLAYTWAAAVESQLSRPGSPPFLQIPGADLQLALTELTAAVDAMR